MPNAAVMGDMVKQTGTHCHLPIHPPAPTPTPAPHPGLPIAVTLLTWPNVMICNKPAATKLSMTAPMSPCTPACPPLGMAMIKQGSGTVKIMNMDAARLQDPTDHPPCKAGAIPDAAGGKVMGPGAPTVMVGG